MTQDNSENTKPLIQGAGSDVEDGTLKSLRSLDSPEETAYDDITRMAADVCGVPIALITLVAEDHQWFKSRVGLQFADVPLEHSFCAHAVRFPSQMLVVRDALLDDRFAANPLVIGDPNIRFYAGAPLVLKNGEAVGTLCVIDRVVRDLSDDQLQTLQFMALQVVSMLETRSERSALDSSMLP